MTIKTIGSTKMYTPASACCGTVVRYSSDSMEAVPDYSDEDLKAIEDNIPSVLGTALNSYFWSGYSTIDTTNDRSKMNYCNQHTHRFTDECLVNAAAIYYWQYYSSSSRTYRKICLTTKGYVKPTKPSYPGLEEVTEELRKEAWAHLQPSLNDGLSVANFLWELKDIRHLRSLARKLKEIVQSFGRKHSNTKTVAEVMLNWEFGIKPFTSDIEKMWDLFNKADKKLNAFISAGREVKAYHFRKDLTVDTTDVGSTSEFEDIIDETISTYSATLHASYTYRKPPKWEATLRMWGLRPTAEVIWNAIPWSFVVDWVIRVGDLLHQLDQDPNLTVHIKEYCDTMKASTTRICTRRKVPSDVYSKYKLLERSSYGRKSQDRLWSWEVRDYERVPGLPNTGYAFPVLDTLSTRELVLSGALLRTFNRS